VTRVLNRRVADLDPWHVVGLDLDAYLARIGIAAEPPSLAALDALHEAHVRAFTFDNIDVLLDAHPGVGLDAVQAKFVGRGRGGYCFEHGVLFAAALERLGYDVERRLGRVGDVAAPRTHCVVLVTIDSGRVLADPGFGMSVLQPIPLTDGAEDDHGGWRYRLREVPIGDGRGWALERWREEHWELMHVHDELPVHPIDLAVAHHFTSTYPPIHFRNMLMLTKHLDGQHVAVTHETLTVRRPGEPTQHRQLRDGELSDLLDELAVPLTADEREALLTRVGGLRSAR
jgi:N-hydroxyarylamine O-acetyltransferase